MSPKPVRSLLLVLLLCAPLCLAVRAADDWRPVDPAHLAMKTPVVEKDADAEVIFWDVKIDDASEDLIFTNYVRIKIFTARGVETQSKVDLEYFGSHRIKDIAGRTIKPDGSIVELKKDAVFDRTLVKISGIKVKVKSFAMPAVEPGGLIEYRWKEVRGGVSANNVRLQFQRDIPVQLVKYWLKPMSGSPAGMNVQTFHGDVPRFVKDKDGFYSTSMTNMPAFHLEPRMPPEDNERTWALVYYSVEKYSDPNKFWSDFGKRIFESSKQLTKVNDDIKKAAAAAIGDASTAEAKLERLYEFCKTKVKNSNSPEAGLTAADRAKLKKNESPADTLKRGIGTGDDITMLFAALAAAAGFETRICLMADRSDIFFDRNIANPYFLNTTDAAVKVGNQWRFFDPGSLYLPFGLLRWQEEGVLALVPDSKESAFVPTPVSSAKTSMQKRTAHLKLSEDGTIEGEVRVEFTGHFAIEKKNDNDDDSATEREKNLTEEIKQHMSTAEVSQIKFENVTDPFKPFAYSYHLKTPGYAQRTGKRLFLQPGFFQYGNAAQFPTSNRVHPIYFKYPWSEEDSVTIDLPAGYALDNADAPQPFMAGEISKYEMKISVAEGRRLMINRSFFFGGNGTLLFPNTSYTPLKNLFDTLHERDNHTITLKQAASAQQ
ncbi:MAG: hypothetical protein DMF61_17845 [Blastocatellia bacterium AA13]|nr:MAG: hypothetical protein DMF61_17845 [Blastocatellia bacterium AA13]